MNKQSGSNIHNLPGCVDVIHSLGPRREQGVHIYEYPLPRRCLHFVLQQAGPSTTAPTRPLFDCYMTKEAVASNQHSSSHQRTNSTCFSSGELSCPSPWERLHPGVPRLAWGLTPESALCVRGDMIG